MKIFVLLGHPDSSSFNGQIVDAYCTAARKKGHEVRVQKLGEMQFDPILWKGYKIVQDLEPDLKKAQENIVWCNKWVIVYPIWWGAVPALLKGFFDRTLYSGFAYKYHEKDPLWDKLLKGRSGKIITTCDAPKYWIRWMYGNSDLKSVKRATMQFCGISPVKVTRISRMKYLNEAQRQRWISKIINKIPSATS